MPPVRDVKRYRLEPFVCLLRRPSLFPTPKSFWRRENEPSLCAFTYSSLQKSATATGGAGELYEARGRFCFVVYIYTGHMFVVCYSLVFLHFPLLFGGARASVEEEDEGGPRCK